MKKRTIIIFSLIAIVLGINSFAYADSYSLDGEGFEIELNSKHNASDSYGEAGSGANLIINGEKMEFTGDESVSTSYEEHVKADEDGYTDYFKGGIDAVPPAVNSSDKYDITSSHDIPTDSLGQIIGKYELVMTQGIYNQNYNDFIDTMILSKATDIKYIEMKLNGSNKLVAEGITQILEDWGVTGAVGIIYTWVDEKGVTQKSFVDLKSQFYLMTPSQKAYNDFINKIKEIGGGGTTTISNPKTESGTWSGAHIPTMVAYLNGVPYDISQGIPTSELLHGSIEVDDIGYEYVIGKASKTISYTATALLSWDWVEGHWEGTGEMISVWTGERDANGKPVFIEMEDTTWVPGYFRHNEITSVTGTYTTHYFIVNYATFSILSSAALNNDAVGEICSVGASGASGYVNSIGNVIFDSSQMSKYYSGASMYGGYSAAYEQVKSAITGDIVRNTYAQNDIMNIKGAGLSGQTRKGEQFKSTPYQAPSTLTDPSINRLNGEGSKAIPSTTLNGIYGSSALANYRDGGFPNGKAQSIGAGAPRVIVHTPVVNKSSIEVNSFENQKINKTAGTIYLMLDEDFKIIMNMNGTHRNIPGYGTRTYNSWQGIYKLKSTWGKIKDVKIPFDVYMYKGDDKVFVPANTWISELGLATDDYNYMFTIPVWVVEKDYIIETKVIAENATVDRYGLIEEGANLNMNSYAAVDRIPVEVIGKIYDLRISNVTDPGWTIKSPGYITAEEFPLGQTYQNENTKYNYAPKLGYTFVFDFKTKGTKSNTIEIIPTKFYFVSKSGGDPIEVDLYYNTATDKFIPIGSGRDNINLQVNLKESFMKVSNQELIDSTRIRGHMFNYGLTVNIGSFGRMLLPENLRLCYNNFAEYLRDKTYGSKAAEAISQDAGGRDTIINSVGHWYAGYRLPASTRALPKGTDITKIVNLNNNSKEILTDGYILVKFDISTIYKNQYGSWSYLAYMGPDALNEGRWDSKISTSTKTQEVTLPNGNKVTIKGGGIVAIYDASLRSSNDVETSGTH